MRTIPIIVAVILSLAIPSVSAAPGTTTVDAPALAPGDTWTYHTNTSLGAGFYFDGHATVTVTGHGPAKIEGTMYDAYNVSVNGAGTASGIFTSKYGSSPASGNWNLTGKQVLEAKGLTVVSSVVDLEADGRLHMRPVELLFRLSVQNTTSYRVLKNPWHFPLNVGDSAVVQGKLNFSEDVRLFYGIPTTPTHIVGVAWWNVTYVLETQVRVDTPAGPFDTYRIRRTYPDRTYTLSLFAPVAGNDARSETHNETTQFSTAELVAYRYQALEPARFLGLTTDQWIIAAVAAASVGVIGSVWWWRKRRKPERSEPGGPPAT